MDAALRESVRGRAGNRCEYCRLRQEWLPTRRLHIEHIVARQHGGAEDAENLALACFHCNQFKGTNLSFKRDESRDHDAAIVIVIFPSSHNAGRENRNAFGKG
jgi:5-methylcytosine-specific restriction endonuclease McrA